MKRIFISSNLASLGNVITNLEAALSHQIHLFENNVSISLSKNNQFIIGISKEAQIILIHDNIEMIENINMENDYLLYHQTIKETLKNRFKKENTIEGHNMPGTQYLYEPIMNIVLSNEQEKANKIIDELFGQKMLDKIKLIKANFLNHIYSGNRPSDFVIPEIVSNTNGISEFLKYFEDYPYNNKDKNLCSVQNIKFLQLRTLLDFK